MPRSCHAVLVVQCSYTQYCTVWYSRMQYRTEKFLECGHAVVLEVGGTLLHTGVLFVSHLCPQSLTEQLLRARWHGQRHHA